MIKSRLLRRPISLSTCLILIVLIAILPVLFFSAVLANRLVESKYEANARLLNRTADQLAFAVDQEVVATIRTLHGLSQSTSLQKGDFKLFHEESVRILRGQSSWGTILLHSPKAEWLLSARQPYGTNLGPAPDPESILRVVHTGEPQLGRLIHTPKINKINSEFGFAVRVPVKDPAGKVIAVLSAILTTEPMQDIVSRFTSTPGEWVRSIVDDRGVIAARTREPEKYIGGSASESMRKLLFAKSSGLEKTTTLDQVEAYTAFRKAPVSGWYSIISVRADDLEDETRKARTTIWTISFLILGFSALVTWLLSKWLKQTLRSSSDGAAVLARGETPVMSPSMITELEELRHSLLTASELLQSRDRAKSEFLANMSHEIRTPLGIILGMTDLIVSKEVTSEEQESIAEIVKRNGEQLLRLINDILDMAKIESNSLNVETVDFSLPELISFVAQDFSTQAAQNGIELQVVIEDGSPQVVSSDPHRLRQIVFNLVSNAVKFTNQGFVEVRLCRLQGELVRITVTDTGIGIPLEHRSQLFTNFSQGDSSHSRKYGGTGLGLALSKKLARRLDGDLNLVASQAGAGSTFEITLKLKQSSGSENPS